MNKTLRWLMVAGAVTATFILPALALISRIYYTPFHVPTGAMIPSVLVGDRFYATTSVQNEPIVRGKIYVFRSPREDNVTFVKRVVAIGGDRISVVGSQVTLNGKKLVQEPVNDLGTPELNALLKDHRVYREKLDDVEYLTMWKESPAHSFPQESFTLEKDELFFLGDNRSDSWDSRFYGPVKREAVTGRPTFVWLSIGPAGVRWDRFFKRLN